MSWSSSVPHYWIYYSKRSDISNRPRPLTLHPLLTEHKSLPNWCGLALCAWLCTPCVDRDRFWTDIPFALRGSSGLAESHASLPKGEAGPSSQGLLGDSLTSKLGLNLPHGGTGFPLIPSWEEGRGLRAAWLGFVLG